MNYNFVFIKRIITSAVCIASILFCLIVPKIVSAQNNSNNDSRTASTLPDIIDAKFQIAANEIFVKAEINGDSVLLMFDTGAPDIIINSSYFNDTSSDYKTTVKSFGWEGIHRQNFMADKGDLSSSKFPVRYAGLMGLEVYKDYEIVYNLPQNNITFIKTDSAGNTIKTLPIKNKKPVSVVPFTIYQQHLVVFKMEVGGKTYGIILDSGAGISGFSPKDFTFKDTSHLQQDYVTAGNPNYTLKKEEDRNLFFVNTAKVGNSIFKNILFRASDWYFESHGGAQGIVGYDFLKQHIITVNYKKKEISIYK